MITVLLLNATMMISAGGWTGDQERLGQVSPRQTRTGGTSAGPDIVHTHAHTNTHIYTNP